MGQIRSLCSAGGIIPLVVEDGADPSSDDYKSPALPLSYSTELRGHIPFAPIDPARFLWLPHQRRNAGRKHHQTVWTGLVAHGGFEPADTGLKVR